MPSQWDANYEKERPLKCQQMPYSKVQYISVGVQMTVQQI